MILTRRFALCLLLATSTITAREVETIGSHFDPINSIDSDDTSQIALTATIPGMVRIHDLATQKEKARFELGYKLKEARLVDGGFITLSDPKTECRLLLRLYDLKTGELKREACASTSGYNLSYKMTVRADRKLISIPSMDPSLFDIPNWKITKVFPQFRDREAFLSATGNLVAFSYKYGSQGTNVIRIADETQVAQLPIGGNFVGFSADDTEVAIVRENSIIPAGPNWAAVWSIGPQPAQIASIPFASMESKWQYAIGLGRHDGAWVAMFYGRDTGPSGLTRHLVRGILLSASGNTDIFFVINAKLEGPVEFLSGGKLAARYKDSSLGIWTLAAPNQPAIIPERIGFVKQVERLNDNTTIVTDNLGIVSWWNVLGREVKRKKIHINPIFSLAISADKKVGLTASTWEQNNQNPDIALWSTDTADVAWQKRRISGETAENARFFGDKDLVITLSTSYPYDPFSDRDSCAVIHRSLSAGEEKKKVIFPKDNPFDICLLSADALRLIEFVKGSTTLKVTVRDVTSREIVSQFTVPYGMNFVMARLLPDNKMVLGLGEGMFAIYNLATGNHLHDLLDPAASEKNANTSIAVSADGTYFVAASDIRPNVTDNPVYSVFDLREKTLVKSLTLTGHKADYYSHVAMDTGFKAFLIGNDGNFKSWYWGN